MVDCLLNNLLVLLVRYLPIELNGISEENGLNGRIFINVGLGNILSIFHIIVFLILEISGNLPPPLFEYSPESFGVDLIATFLIGALLTILALNLINETILQRTIAEQEVRNLNSNLEARVEKRTEQ